jgi:hypothetical protein
MFHPIPLPLLRDFGDVPNSINLMICRAPINVSASEAPPKQPCLLDTLLPTLNPVTAALSLP